MTLDNRLELAVWPVMVLAHNEERHIEACLESIFAADPDCRFEVYVMANGCTDKTHDIVLDYGRRRPEVHLVSIALSDKCNAWNMFVHETVPAECPGRYVYFFMDGDARALRGSFSAMARALRENPYAHVASAVPASGRSMRRDREKIMRRHGLVANLYSLRGSFVERLRAQSARLPLNLEGDDGLVGALAKWDLKPASKLFDHARIVPCADAAFTFESLSPLRKGDWGRYWNRLTRYGRRRYEFRLLGPVLESRGLPAMPVDITELYLHAESLQLSWDGIYTLPNLMVLRQMRRLGKQKEKSRRIS